MLTQLQPLAALKLLVISHGTSFKHTDARLMALLQLCRGIHTLLANWPTIESELRTGLTGVNHGPPSERSRRPTILTNV